MLARQSGWVTACLQKIDALRDAKETLFPDATGEEKARRDRGYDREIKRWTRRLFWARYGHIRAALVGTTIGGILGYFLIDLIPL